MRNLWRAARCLCLVLPALLSAGCRGPIIAWVAETQIREDGTTSRHVIVNGIPRQRREVDLGRYLHLPDRKAYQTYEVAPERAVFAGTFPTPDAMPVDFAKSTRGVEMWAHNRFRILQRDYVLMQSWYFEERIDDIVERTEAEETLDQSLKILLAASLTAMEAHFGEDYDLSGFEQYLRETLPPLVGRLYQAFWEIRRSRPATRPVPGEEEEEWEERLVRELDRIGLRLQPGFDAASRQVNKARLYEFLDQKLHEHAHPRREGVPPLTIKMFLKRETQTALLAKLKESIVESYGSLDNFLQKLQPAVPLVFGAFFEQEVSLMPDVPLFQFVFRARLPGHVVETNGARDLDGAVTWRFGSREMILTGYQMRAQTLVIDSAALQRLHLKGFPGSLAVAERFSAAMRGPDGEPHPQLVALLRNCVKAGSLQPLQKASIPVVGAGADAERYTGVPPSAASHLLGIIGAFYQTGPVPVAPKRPEAPLPDPAPEREADAPATPEEDAQATPPAAAPDPEPPVPLPVGPELKGDVSAREPEPDAQPKPDAQEKAMPEFPPPPEAEPEPPEPDIPPGAPEFMD